MALQDLTPQLRTRLSRLERRVGIFVGIAVLLLLAGLSYYVYDIADRKGWFVRKLPYFTFVESATGLHEGDPIKLMGFDIGEITEINAQPPFAYYDVYVAFVVKEKYVGYLWDDSRARIGSSDFLGKRGVEVTKGTNGPPTYSFHEMRSVSLAAAESLIDSTNMFLGQSVYDSTRKNRLAIADKPFDRQRWQSFVEAGVENLVILDKSTRTKWPAGIWDYKEARYVPFDREKDKGYFLPPVEDPALAARLEKLADTVELALPNILGLTNGVNRALAQATTTAESADTLLNEARPLLQNLTQISANLTNANGALGEWVLPRDLRRQLNETLASANRLVLNSDRQVGGISTNLTSVLINLAAVTSNLNAQVVANSNILSEISSAVTNADHLMQGLRRHWLLRSAFKEPARPKTERPKPKPQPTPNRTLPPRFFDPR